MSKILHNLKFRKKEKKSNKLSGDEQAMVEKEGEHGKRGDRLHLQQKEEQLGECGLVVRGGGDETQEGEYWKCCTWTFCR